MNKVVFSALPGKAFRDREGHRWCVKGKRPGPEGQLVVEEEIPGSYPKIAVYTMTEGQFREHARNADLRPESVSRVRAASAHPR